MTEPRDPYDELYEVILQALVHSPTTNGMLGRADAVTDAVYAAYPQLAATDSREEWTVVAAPGARLPNMFDEDMARRWVKVDRKRGVTSTVVRRTVYATPWEDA